MEVIRLSLDEPLPFERLFKTVFRDSAEKGGAGAVCVELCDRDSVAIRKAMVEIKTAFSDFIFKRSKQKLVYHWLGRFDQQESTLFHRDNAAETSCLMLGYEPSDIFSELWIADHSRFKFEMPDKDGLEGILNQSGNGDPKEFDRYIKGIEFPPQTHFRIVLINNSVVDAPYPGVLHQAIVPKQDLSKSRMINSVMLNVVGDDEREVHNPEMIENFISTGRVVSRSP